MLPDPELRTDVRRNLRRNVTMPSLRNCWRGRRSILALYAACVFCVEYVLHHMILPSTIRDVYTDQDVLGTGTARNLSQTERTLFLAGLNNHVGLNRNFFNVTSLTWDKSELYLIQMRLNQCAQKRTDILKCLEEEYIKQRKIFIEDHKNIIAKSGQNFRTPAPAPTPMPPRRMVTDNPKDIAAFFTKSPKKVCPYKFNVTVQPKSGCGANTSLVALVHSFHPYLARREAIRNTWGGVIQGRIPWPKRTVNKTMKLFFVLAMHKDPIYNQKVLNESRKYDDIIIGNFMDAYRNLTYKSLLGLKYVSETCSGAKYLLKTDDDMMINVPHLLNILEKNPMQRSIMGPLNRGSMVKRSGKWKVDIADYPFRYYPPYEGGAAYVITNDVVRELFDTAEYVPQIHVDDVYITGFLGKIINVTHVIRPGFTFWTDKAPVACDFITDKKISGSKMTPSNILSFWQVLQTNVKCPKR